LTFEDLPAIKPFFDWSGSLSVAAWINQTPHVFPFIETIHLLALTVLLSTILLQDLRLLGVGLIYWSPARVARQMNRLMTPSLAVIVITGYLLFSSEADKAYHNPAFFWKMTFLAAAIVQHYGFQIRVQQLDMENAPVWAKWNAVLSLALWFGVGIMGRAIGFVVGTGPS
jgi:hypothetical protein